MVRALRTEDIDYKCGNMILGKNAKDRPNTDDLGLEKAGVSADKRGYIVVDDQLRTSAPGIWALGDCNGKGPLRTPLSTMPKLSPRIFSTTTRAGSVIGFPRTALHRPAARTGWRN
jgi:hypothetical protein